MRTNPESLAWRILVTALLVFLLLCGSIGYVVRWYIFESSVNLQVELAAARGTVRVIPPNTQESIAVTDRRPRLEIGADIQTDASQAILTFTEPHTGVTVASLVLLNDSRIRLIKATAPRFGLNRASYTIEMESPAGRSELYLMSPGRRGFMASIDTPHAHLELVQNGHYVIDITEQRTRFVTETGRAVVEGRDTGDTIELRDEQRVIVEASGQPLILLSSEVSLLDNSRFIQGLEEGWQPYSDGEPPPGLTHLGSFDARSVLTFDRSQSNWPDLRLGHGESGMRQLVNADVRHYNYLEIRSTFFIEEQSLSTCGQLGSECPMMIRVNYIDVQGVQREFIQGFYAYHDPAVDYPLTCDTCRGEHERINLQSWYTYKSGNLLTILPAEQEPVVIRQVRFYASGHAYRVHVAEMDLLAAP